MLYPYTLGWLTRFPRLLIPFRGSLLSIRPSSARSPLSPDLLTRIRRQSSSPLPENLIFPNQFSFILPISLFLLLLFLPVFMHLLPYRPQKLGEKHGDLLLGEIQKIDHLKGWGETIGYI